MLKCQKFYKSSEEYKKINVDDQVENSLFENSFNSFETVESFEFLSHLSKFFYLTDKLLNYYIQLYFFLKNLTILLKS